MATAFRRGYASGWACERSSGRHFTIGTTLSLRILQHGDRWNRLNLDRIPVGASLQQAQRDTFVIDRKHRRIGHTGRNIRIRVSVQKHIDDAALRDGAKDHPLLRSAYPLATGAGMILRPETAADSRAIRLLTDAAFKDIEHSSQTEAAIIDLLRALRDEGRVMLVSTHNLGSVPEFCDRTVLLNRTVLAYGPTVDVFTQDNLERAFGGVLRHFVLNERADGKSRRVGVFTDDERALVLYGRKGRLTSSTENGEGGA